MLPHLQKILGQIATCLEPCVMELGSYQVVGIVVQQMPIKLPYKLIKNARLY